MDWVSEVAYLKIYFVCKEIFIKGEHKKFLTNC